MKMRSENNVIRLKEFQRTVSFPAINEVVAYWEGLRGGRPVPMRSEVNPRGIESALSNAFILERIAPGMARFRLAGAHLSDLMGMEVRGMPFTSFFTPDARKEVGAALEAVFQSPEIVEIMVTADTGIGKPDLYGKVVLLPLKSDLGDITRALGCFVTEGEIGRSPRRFGVTDRKVTQIATALVTPPSAREKTAETEFSPPSFTSDVIPGFEEAKSTFIAAPKEDVGRPNLRLISFDD
ncbi:PAS domain-containing protein [Falsihalocynthiibacter sp. S25ZX9]|uniref:PAS domain-containing protein n=1 Tax=Falsihalocynthiibacter sp. S25ZX9 TaxID=3240870 RepID=UPI00350EB9E7